MICTVLPNRLFSQLNHTATHFCLHFPIVTITSQIADWVLVKFTQIFFIIYPSFLKFPHRFSKFPRRFSEYSTNFFLKFQKILLKINTFSNFCLIFSTVSQSLIDILSGFLQISQIIFQRFTQSLYKVTVEICPTFYSGLLKNFLASFRSVSKFFFDIQIIFLRKLIVSNFFCLNFIVYFIKQYL